MVSALQLPAPLQRNIIYIPRVLCYVLVVLIAITAAKMVWSLVGGGAATSDDAPKISSTPPKLVKPPAPRPDYGSQIARLHLMGKAAAASATAIQTQAPDTSLNLSLNGVLALGDGEGFAIIANESKKHKFYQIDDEVTSGVRLNAVFNDYVLLDRGGRSEKLRLPKATLGDLNKPINRTANTNASANSRSRAATPAPTNEPVVEDTSSLANLRKELTKNPASIGKFMLITPENDGESGKFKGFRVQPNQESSALFYDLGLMDNDLVISINDITLDNPNKGTQVFQQLVSAKEIAMTVLRDGTEITLLHNLE